MKLLYYIDIPSRKIYYLAKATSRYEAISKFHRKFDTYNINIGAYVHIATPEYVNRNKMRIRKNHQAYLIPRTHTSEELARLKASRPARKQLALEARSRKRGKRLRQFHKNKRMKLRVEILKKPNILC